MKGIEKVRAFLAEQDADGLLVTRRDNYLWLTGGHRNEVMRDTPNGVGTLIVTRDGLALLADSSDCARLSQEENPLDARPVLIPWYGSAEETLRREMGGGRFLSDDGAVGTPNVQSELVDLRMRLTPEELAAYRSVGADCAEVVEGVCQSARPGQTEQEIAALVCREAVSRGIHPDCVLVGADERIDRYRHPMPTDAPIGRRLMVVLGGERRGLYISITRMVYFAPPPAEVLETYQALGKIFANMQLGMRDGLPYRGYFAQVQGWYRAAGFPEEWKLHHQGGPTGYACRELVVRPDTPGCLRSGQAYAWNPSITGVKCEETTYLGEDGPETFTRTNNWPVREVDTELGRFGVAEILVK